MALHERKIYPKFKGTVQDGRLIFEDTRSFQNYIASLEGKVVNIIVKVWHKDRSRQEEKFYHAVVARMVAEEMGIDDQEAHNLLKSLFLAEEESKQIETPTGPKLYRYKRILSTTELTDKAYREYWEKCIRWAALPTKPEGLSQDSGLELYIPLPNEVDYSDY